MGHHPVEDSNRSGNRPFDDIVKTRLSRRRLLTGTASAATVGVLGSLKVNPLITPFCTLLPLVAVGPKAINVLDVTGVCHQYLANLGADF